MRARDWRRKEALTQAEVGLAVGIHPTTVGRLEAGAINPQPDTILGYAEASKGAVGPEDWYERAGALARRYRGRAKQ